MVGAEIAFVGLHEQAMQAVENHAAGFVAVDLFAGGGDEFFFLLFRGAEFVFQLSRFVFQRFVLG